jgi:hypothetical protein
MTDLFLDLGRPKMKSIEYNEKQKGELEVVVVFLVL